MLAIIFSSCILYVDVGAISKTKDQANDSLMDNVLIYIYTLFILPFLTV